MLSTFTNCETVSEIFLFVFDFISMLQKVAKLVLSVIHILDTESSFAFHTRKKNDLNYFYLTLISHNLKHFSFLFVLQDIKIRLHLIKKKNLIIK